MEGAALDPTTTLIVAFLGMLGVTIPPILLMITNRGGKAAAPAAPAVDLVADLDEINERLSNENDRLTRENQRLREQLTRERLEHARDLLRKDP